mgnify:CR=1 FL=1
MRSQKSRFVYDHFLIFVYGKHTLKFQKYYKYGTSTSHQDEVKKTEFIILLEPTKIEKVSEKSFIRQ